MSPWPLTVMGLERVKCHLRKKPLSLPVLDLEGKSLLHYLPPRISVLLVSLHRARLQRRMWHWMILHPSPSLPAVLLLLLAVLALTRMMTARRGVTEGWKHADPHISEEVFI